MSDEISDEKFKADALKLRPAFLMYIRRVRRLTLTKIDSGPLDGLYQISIWWNPREIVQILTPEDTKRFLRPFEKQGGPFMDTWTPTLKQKYVRKKA